MKTRLVLLAFVLALLTTGVFAGDHYTFGFAKSTDEFVRIQKAMSDAMEDHHRLNSYRKINRWGSICVCRVADKPSEYFYATTISHQCPGGEMAIALQRMATKYGGCITEPDKGQCFSARP